MGPLRRLLQPLLSEIKVLLLSPAPSLGLPAPLQPSKLHSERENRNQIPLCPAQNPAGFSSHWAGQRALGRPPASPPAFLPSPGQALLPARPVLHPCVLLPPAAASAVSAAFPSPASRGQFLLHVPCLLSDSALSGPPFRCPESALRTGGLHPRPSAFEVGDLWMEAWEELTSPPHVLVPHAFPPSSGPVQGTQATGSHL